MIVFSDIIFCLAASFGGVTLPPPPPIVSHDFSNIDRIRWWWGCKYSSLLSHLEAKKRERERGVGHHLFHSMHGLEANLRKR